MKVEKGKDQFTPITITLETEDEAKLMWACLNISMPILRQNSSTNRRVVASIATTTDLLWSLFNGVYRPKEANY